MFERFELQAAAANEALALPRPTAETEADRTRARSEGHGPHRSRVDGLVAWGAKPSGVHVTFQLVYTDVHLKEAGRAGEDKVDDSLK